RSPTVLFPPSLHDALPIFEGSAIGRHRRLDEVVQLPRNLLRQGEAVDLEDSRRPGALGAEVLGSTSSHFRDGFAKNLPILTAELDRKSTRLNSSHQIISYA